MPETPSPLTRAVDSGIDVDGKHVVITGASSGIGAAACRRLAARGAMITAIGRNLERTRAIADQVGGTAIIADFAKFSDVRALAETLLADERPIDVLALNAGGLLPKRVRTEDGNDLAVQTNHLAHLLLTELLLPKLRADAASSHDVRVVSTSSVAHRTGLVRVGDLNLNRRPWLSFQAYGTVKLLNVLFTQELARRTEGTGIRAYAFHPGPVRTNFGNENPLVRRFYGSALAARSFLTAEQGADPLVWLAGAPSIAAPSGTYFDRLNPEGALNPQAKRRQLPAKVWEASLPLIGLAT